MRQPESEADSGGGPSPLAVTTPTLLEDLEALRESPRRHARRLFEILCDTHLRETLYRDDALRRQPIEFLSITGDDPRTAWLLTSRAHVEQALRDPACTSEPYQAIGGKTNDFMLGLDDSAGRCPHASQRGPALAVFGVDEAGGFTPGTGEVHGWSEELLASVARRAWNAASTLALKQREFDLARLAEMAAVHYVRLLYGFESHDLPYLQGVMRGLYGALNHRIIARHFVGDAATAEDPTAAAPANPVEAARQRSEALGHFAQRIVALLRTYALGRWPADAEVLSRHDADDAGAPAVEPILQRLARSGMPANDAVRLVRGAIGGTIGNLQAAVCATVDQLLEADRQQGSVLQQARRWIDGSDARFGALVLEAMRLDPPAAFLPRRTRATLTLCGEDGTALTIPKDTDLVLAIGSALRDDAGEPGAQHGRSTLDPGADRDGDPLIWGNGRHWCFGRPFAEPLIRAVVRNVLRLPGLEPLRATDTGASTRLQRTWGVLCRPYWLRYDAQARLLQQPLCVVMRVREPVPVHAAALRQVIAWGAPQIEQSLSRSNHVHFAAFTFGEGDRTLTLNTVFDGDRDAYLDHFATMVGPLFDQLFEHVQDPPPLPVGEHPRAFAAKIREYDVRPAGGYFFSAYPRQTVAAIRSAFRLPPPPASPAVAQAGHHRATPRAAVDSAQAIVLRPYRAGAVEYLLLHADDPRRARAFLALLLDADRLAFGFAGCDDDMATCRVNLGVTYEGLRRLDLIDAIPAVDAELARLGQAFREGAWHRAGSHLGDLHSSRVEAWDPPFRPGQAHLVLSVFGAGPAEVASRVTDLLEQAQAHGLRAVHRQADDAGAANPGANPYRGEKLGHDHYPGAGTTAERKGMFVHFGYRDGVQPINIAGLAPASDDEHAAGEFLLGHPNNSGANEWAVKDSEARAFLHNGSFAALRVMEQAEHVFRRFIHERASAEGMTVPLLHAKLCGRWANGSRLKPDVEAPGSAAREERALSRFADDREGAGCPFSAHIRRMNPRDDPVLPARRRPLMRRGMPYGPVYADTTGNFVDDGQSRGLLGLFFCASLEEQFEHVLSRWANTVPMGSRDGGSASDPLIGNRDAGAGELQIPRAGGRTMVRLGNMPTFVRTRGTLYAFYPSRDALRMMAWLPDAAGGA